MPGHFALLSRFRGSSYWFAVAIGLVGALFTIPVATNVGGPAAWAALAAGQALGAIGGVVVFLGWNVLGPVRIARLDDSARAGVFLDSLWGRITALLIVLPIVLGTAAFISRQSGILELMAPAAMSAMVSALGASWFFVGAAQPNRLVVVDALPRLFFVVVGSLGAVLASDLRVLPWFQLVGEVLIVTFSAVLILAPIPKRSLPSGVCSMIRRGVSSNLHGLATSVTAATYSQLPVVFGTAMGVPALPQIALADRIQKMTLRAMLPTAQIAQAYVPRAAEKKELVARTIYAVRLISVVGVVAAVAFAAGVRPLAKLLSLGQIEVSWQLSVLFGIAVGAVVVTGVLGPTCLAAWDRRDALVTSTIVGSGIGVLLMLTIGTSHGGLGLAFALVVAEICVLAWQATALHRTISNASGVSKGS
ncbi:MAG TPA: hypothetical protein PLQ19_00840 [Aeromicrobium sp.]|nr:hypothetical protein [Aeromicrobium sp.]